MITFITHDVQDVPVECAYMAGASNGSNSDRYLRPALIPGFALAARTGACYDNSRRLLQHRDGAPVLAFRMAAGPAGTNRQAQSRLLQVIPWPAERARGELDIGSRPLVAGRSSMT
jgi:hypothetical protein